MNSGFFGTPRKQRASSLYLVGSEISVLNTPSMIVPGMNDAYPEYELHFDLKPVTDNVAWRVEFSGDNGVTWLASGYKWAGHVWYSNGFATALNSDSASIITHGEQGNAAGEHLNGVLHFLNPRTTDQQMVTCIANSVTQQPYFAHYDLVFGNTTLLKLSAVRFTFASGNVAAGKARLYGIKNS